MKFTSGGIDNGARPICDGRDVVAENDLEETAGKAGSRNDGRDMEDVEAIALSRPLDLAVGSIANWRSMVVCLSKYRASYFGNLTSIMWHVTDLVT